MTLFAGENGCDKSTLIEEIALAAGFNADGGSRHMTIATRASHSPLHDLLVRGIRRERTGYVLPGRCSSACDDVAGRVHRARGAHMTALSPVLFGSGIRLFEGVDASRVALEPVRAEPTQRVTHLTQSVREW
jgi:hypothetical protein